MSDLLGLHIHFMDSAYHRPEPRIILLQSIFAQKCVISRWELVIESRPLGADSLLHWSPCGDVLPHMADCFSCLAPAFFSPGRYWEGNVSAIGSGLIPNCECLIVHLCNHRRPGPEIDLFRLIFPKKIFRFLVKIMFRGRLVFYFSRLVWGNGSLLSR